MKQKQIPTHIRNDGERETTDKRPTKLRYERPAQPCYVSCETTDTGGPSSKRLAMGGTMSKRDIQKKAPDNSFVEFSSPKKLDAWPQY